VVVVVVAQTLALEVLLHLDKDLLVVHLLDSHLAVVVAHLR
jgi:hypothetical protein